MGKPEYLFCLKDMVEAIEQEYGAPHPNYRIICRSSRAIIDYANGIFEDADRIQQQKLKVVS